jgi:hypothetical protein
MKQAQKTMQAMPVWSLDAEAAPSPTRSATVIPFPGGAVRGRRIVTFPARIGLPVRQGYDEADTPPPTWHAVLMLAGIGLLLLVTLLHAT